MEAAQYFSLRERVGFSEDGIIACVQFLQQQYPEQPGILIKQLYGNRGCPWRPGVTINCLRKRVHRLVRKGKLEIAERRANERGGKAALLIRVPGEPVPETVIPPGATTEMLQEEVDRLTQELAQAHAEMKHRQIANLNWLLSNPEIARLLNSEENGPVLRMVGALAILQNPDLREKLSVN